MERVVYYARVSTEEEQQASALVTQCKENEDFITAHGDWQLVDKYIDEGKSGTTVVGRKAFSKMVSDMLDDKFDIILIKQIDRGWRNLTDWKAFESELVRSGKRLFIRLRNDFYNIEDDGNYISTTMDSMFAEWYSRNLSKKMNNAHKTRMNKGTIVTNGKLWGYDQVNADLVINESEAEVVRRVFQYYIEGYGFRTIALKLDSLGIKNQKGNMFAVTTLKRMIRNEKYKGTLVCGKRHMNFFTKEYVPVPESEWITHDNRVTPIVSEEVWNEANKILQQRRKTLDIDKKAKVAGYFNGSYPLSGKIVCGKCGKPYYHTNVFLGPKDRKEEYGAWMCSTYRKYGKNHELGCDNKWLYDNDLNSIIRTKVYEIWQNREQILKDIVKILNDTLSDTANNAESEESIRAETKRLQSKKDQLIDLYSDALITKDEFKRKSSHLVNLIEEQGNRLANLSQTTNSNESKFDRLSKIKEFFDTSFVDENGIDEEIIKAFVKKVTVFSDHRLELEFNGSNNYSHNAITCG